ncbi:MAG: AmmeMemoRadiSam system protein B [Candidatus Altiarchaeota archaeon]|nr:AmmeMemoRadiSam system protein B [Candidatus Altiarchaeota archaeon]
MIRNPAAIGFYPAEQAQLELLLSELFLQAKKSGPFIHGISPHAGLIYSGLAAAGLYKSLKKTDRLVILGTDHHGIGDDIVVHPYSAWKTPFGQVKVDTELAAELDTLGPQIYPCPSEHSIEVQLPFLQHILGDFSFLPITVPSVPFPRLQELGAKLAELDVPIIASSDMSHYVPEARAEKLDKLAIEQILAIQPEQLIDTVLENNISMCGLFPVAALLASLPSSTSSELIEYYSSAEMTGDSSSVVGYASIGFK